MSPPKLSFKRGWSTPQLTQIEGCPDRSALKGGMAHFANTGPFGETCGNCTHLGTGKQGLARCMMFRKLTGRLGEYINKNYLACKYFETRPKPEPRPISAKHKPSASISATEAEVLRAIKKRPPPHLK